MKVYVSEHGEVIAGDVVNETPKGYRVITNRYGRPFERLYLKECPNGNHRTFTSKEEALADAEKYIATAIDRLEGAIGRLEDKRAKLLVV